MSTSLGTKGIAYLITLDGLEKVEIQYVPPQIAWDRRANDTDVAIVGRNLPKGHHTGGEKVLVLNLDFYSVDASRQDVIEKIMLLESWTYNEEFNTGVEDIKLVFGKLFRLEVWRVKRVRPNITHFTNDKFLPMQATVEVILSQSGNVTRQGKFFEPKRSDIVWQRI